MKVALYGVHFQDAPWPGSLGALQRACKDRGFRVKTLNGKYFGRLGYESEVEPCDVAFVTGAQQGFALIPPIYEKLGVPCFVLDLGWLRREWGYNQVSPFGLNRLFPGEYPDDRLRDLRLELKSRRSGSRVLICGQKANDAQHDLGGIEQISTWVDHQIDMTRQHTDREIVFRPHPRSIFMSRRADRWSDPKHESLRECIHNHDIDVAVMYNSTSALECLIEGVAVVALAQRPMYADLVGSSISEVAEPFFPDHGALRDFLCRLSYHQYTPPELITWQPIEQLISRFKEPQMNVYIYCDNEDIPMFRDKASELTRQGATVRYRNVKYGDAERDVDQVITLPRYEAQVRQIFQGSRVKIETFDGSRKGPLSRGPVNVERSDEESNSKGHQAASDQGPGNGSQQAGDGVAGQPGAQEGRAQGPGEAVRPPKIPVSRKT